MRPSSDTKPPASTDLRGTWLNGVLLPCVGAAVWILVLGDSQASADGQQSLLFILGPLLLLVGIHSRLAYFLHDPIRFKLIPLPLHPIGHWRSAIRSHRMQLMATAAAGTTALALSSSLNPLIQRPLATALICQWAALCLVAFGVEPLAAGLQSALGRRFEQATKSEASAMLEFQSYISGGWTTPEAAIHLYAPALAIGLSTLLAMPLQLIIQYNLSRAGEPTALVVASAIIAAICLAAVFLGRRLYTEGLFESVPWLFEAIRTLAGPPIPEVAPAWVRNIKSPTIRLVLIQFMRVTPLPYLRAGLTVAWAAGLLMGQLYAATVIIGTTVAAGIWIVPNLQLYRNAHKRASLCGGLPLAGNARRGTPTSVHYVVLLPAAALFAIATLTRI